MCNSLKVSAVAGLAVGPGGLAGGAAGALTITLAVAGLAAEACMGLANLRIRRRGRRIMAAYAQRHRAHDMGMVMVVKVRAVTGLAVRARGFAYGTTDPAACRPVMASRTAKPDMGLTSGGVRGGGRRIVTARTFRMR